MRGITGPFRRFIPDVSSSLNKKESLNVKPAELKKAIIPLPIPPYNPSAKRAPLSNSVSKIPPSDSRNIHLSFFSSNHGDRNAIFAAPKIFPKTDPFYFPREAVERGISSEAAFKEENPKGSYETPRGECKHPLVGKKAKIEIDGRIRKATVIGFDYRERPIVHLRGDPLGTNRIITDEDTARLFIPEKGEYQTCINSLEKGNVFRPNKNFIRLMNHILTQPIVGTKSAMDYVEWLHHHGSEAFITGGTVRDLCRESLRRNLSKSEAENIVHNDIDVSVIGGTQTALSMARGVHPDHDPDLHIVGIEEFGSLHVKKGNNPGFDYSAMMIGNHSYDPRRIHPDIEHEGLLVPARFGGLPEKCAEALDFCCNALMYDPINQVIIDPTGYGLEDAVHGFLRLTGGDTLMKSPEESLAFKQPEMLQRFWKFRFRGLRSNAYTTLCFQEGARRRWSKIEPIRMYHDVLRMLPVAKLTGTESERRLQLEKMIDKLGEKMAEDNLVSGTPFPLFENYIAPNRNNIVDYIINYKKKA